MGDTLSDVIGYTYRMMVQRKEWRGVSENRRPLTVKNKAFTRYQGRTSAGHEAAMSSPGASQEPRGCTAGRWRLYHRGRGLNGLGPGRLRGDWDSWQLGLQWDVFSKVTDDGQDSRTGSKNGRGRPRGRREIQVTAGGK